MPDSDTTSVEERADAEQRPATTGSERAADPAEEPCGDQPLAVRLEALLIAADRPLTEARIAALLGIETKGAARRVRETIDELNAAYDEGGRAFRAERLAGGWQLLTRTELGPLLVRMHSERQLSRLSQAALETLAIVAYRQPIMRAEIEAIRGVASGEVLRGLLERRLVKITGRAEELGRPMLYGTTKEFLNVFGLSGPEDLPEVEGLDPRRAARERAGSHEPPAAVAAEPAGPADEHADRQSAAAADASPDEETTEP